MSKLARFFVILCLGCFIGACVVATSEGIASNANETCGYWCEGPPSQAAYTECVRGCLGVLR